MADRFEVLPGTDLVATDINVTVTDPNGIAPALVIRQADPWKVTATWSLSGTFSTALHGRFRVHVHVESMGRGSEKHVGETIVQAQQVNPANYTAVIDVPGGILEIPPGLPGHPGYRETSAAYKVVTLVTYEWCNGEVGAMAGYNEGPILQVYEP